MSQGIHELQRGAILKMLSVGNSGDFAGAQTWKVLVYDKFCQEAIAPLLKVGGLRNHGVTLNVSITSDRSQMTDVPAVYFVEPTRENITLIGKDLEKGLYESCYINFASSVPRPLLEELAQLALKANAAQKVSGVSDRYISFVSLSPTLFSLNLPSAYATIYEPGAPDAKLEAYVERIVDGLLSVLVTQRSVPIIRCSPNDVVSFVARRLDQRLRELLKSRDSSELFSAADSGPARPGAVAPGARALDAGGSGAVNRPVLVILDRNVDLVTMLNHTWTYQAMAHDVLGLRLNKIKVPVESPGGGSTEQSYDVDSGDAFWVANAGEPFPAAADACSKAIEEFEKKRREMQSGGDGAAEPGASLAPELAAAINALPEMTEKKRSIDMHTNIATALLSEVKTRSLDYYYQMEDQFSSQSIGASVSDMEKLLNDSGKGTILDKTRALMVLYLTKPSVTPQQLEGLIGALQAKDGDPSGLSYLRYLSGIQGMSVPSLVTTREGNTSKGGGLLSMATGGLEGLAGSLAAGMSNIKNILPSKKELAICQILEGLMEQKVGSVADNYLYLDPKAPPAAPGGEAPRIRGQFKRGMAFVVGGGNYCEMQSLQEWAQEKGRQVTYGSTDLVSPSQFVQELCHLGRLQCGAPTDNPTS